MLQECESAGAGEQAEYSAGAEGSNLSQGGSCAPLNPTLNRCTRPALQVGGRPRHRGGDAGAPLGSWLTQVHLLAGVQAAGAAAR